MYRFCEYTITRGRAEGELCGKPVSEENPFFCKSCANKSSAIVFMARLDADRRNESRIILRGPTREVNFLIEDPTKRPQN